MTIDDLFNRLGDYYLSNNYITELEAKAKRTEFIKRFDDSNFEILNKAIDYWFKHQDRGRYPGLETINNDYNRIWLEKSNKFITENETSVELNSKGQTLQGYLTEQIYTKHLEKYQNYEYEKGKGDFNSMFELSLVWANKEIEQAEKFATKQGIKVDRKIDEKATQEARERGAKLSSNTNELMDTEE